MPDQSMALASLGRVVAVLRSPTSERVLATARAVVDGGVQTLEITLNTPDALALIKDARADHPSEIRIGAGTVLTAADADAAIAAGAEFLVTPTVVPDVLHEASGHGVPVVCGAFSPTEIYAAWVAGAAAVKIFPIRTLGPAYLADVLGPLAGIPLVPSGGVTAAEVPVYLRAGAAAVAIGGGVLSPGLVSGDFDRVRSSCEQIISSLPVTPPA